MGLSWPWITGFAVLSATANIVFLLGCISPAIKDICLYRVNVTLLADGLQKLALVDGGNETELLHYPELLPTYWYWGMSGICDVLEETRETRCRRAFPPIKNLLGILEDSLRDRLGSDQEQLTHDIVSSWNATLNNISPNRLAAKEAKFVAQNKASAALAIAAIVLDVGIIFRALCLRNGANRPRTYYMPFVSTMMALAAGTLAVLAMGDGVHGVVDTGEHGGPGIMIVFIGAALRLLSCGGSGFGASGNTIDLLWMSRNDRIGFLGEHHIYAWLERRLASEWSYENWTSKLRVHAKYPEFGEPEGGYADFTYKDHSLRMLQVLRDNGVPESPEWSSSTTYHLEVKSTPLGRDAPALVSENQVHLMGQYQHDPLNAYILVRVSHVEREPTIRFFYDPLSHLGLDWGPLRDDGYYPVYTRY